ncbi:hypothetical protein [Pedobacter sp. ASV28]|uniref:hypothetical protein n=1 Tax=Pedobacter sp. ASV28 TaxID=2795123 RepID=UPI0018EDCE0D|nr:hypothetical protein [Pedobacter sp. ASV28]
MSFDIWLSSHASQFDLHAKHRIEDAYNPTAFMDRNGYDQRIEKLQKQLNQKLGNK